MKKIITSFLVFSGALSVTAPAFAASNIHLDCTNSRSGVRSISLSRADYDFLMFGNNHLEGKAYRVMKSKRQKKIFIVDKLDSNIETAVYDCVIRSR